MFEGKGIYKDQNEVPTQTLSSNKWPTITKFEPKKVMAVMPTQTDAPVKVFDAGNQYDLKSFQREAKSQTQKIESKSIGV